MAVTLNQKCADGTFVNDPEVSWGAQSCNLTIANNTASCVGNNTSGSPRIQTNPSPSIAYETVKKIIVRFKARVDNSDCQSINARLTATGMTTNTVNLQTNPVANQWYEGSVVLAASAGGSGYFGIQIAHTYADAATANTKVMEVQAVNIIDATVDFGATINVPDKAWLDTKVAAYFASTTTVPKERFWVGGAGNWSDYTVHWAAYSGGPEGATEPGSSTDLHDVFFDANSGFTGYTGYSDIYAETNQSSEHNLSSAHNTRVGQVIQTDYPIPIRKLKFYLKKYGAPTGNIYAYLYAATGTFGSTTKGTGTALDTSDPIDVTSLSSSEFGLIEFTFSTPYRNPVKLTNYVVCIGYESGDASNYVIVGADNTTKTHEGNLTYYTAGAWTASSDDCIFYMYLSEQVAVDGSGHHFRNMDWTGAPNWPTWYCQTGGMNICGSITLISDMGYTWESGQYLAPRFLDAGSSGIWNFAGVPMYKFGWQSNSSGVFQLASDVTVSDDLTFYGGGGGLKTNGYTVNANHISFDDYAGNKTFDITDSIINISNYWYNAVGTGVTLTTTNSTINFSGTGEFRGGGFTYNIVNFTNTCTITGTSTFTQLNFVPGQSKTFTLPASTQTVTDSVTIDQYSTLTCATTAYISYTGTGSCNIDLRSTRTNITFSAPNAPANKRYWVGDGGTFSDNTNHWSILSGWVPGAALPTTTEAVYFDSKSFRTASQTVNISADITVKSFDCTGITNNPTFTSSASSFMIRGYFTLAPTTDMTWFTSPATSFGTTASVLCDIDPKGHGLYGYFSSGTGYYRLISTWGGGQVVVTAGQFSSNGQDITISGGELKSSYTNVRTVNLDGSTININNGSDIVFTDPTNLTFSAVGTTFNLNSGTVSFGGGGLTWPTVNCSATEVIIAGSNTFSILEIAAAKTVTFADDTTQQFTADIILGEGAIVRATTGATLQYNGTGPTSLPDTYTRTNITVTTPNAPANKRYWVTNGTNSTGNWNTTDTTHWASLNGFFAGFSAPTSADDVYFTIHSCKSTGTITIPASTTVSCKSLDFTGATSNLTLATVDNTSIIQYYGNLTMAAAMNIAVADGGIYAKGTTDTTATMNGRTIPNYIFGISKDSATAKLTLMDTLGCATLSTGAGYFDATGRTINCGFFWTNNNTSTRTVNITNATINLGGSYSSSCFSATSQANCTFIVAGSIINVNNTYSGGSNFNGGGLTFNRVNFNQICKIAQNNTFDIMSIAASKTVTFTDSSTQIVSTDFIMGSGATLQAQTVTGANLTFNGTSVTALPANYTKTNVTVTAPNAPAGKRYWVGGGGLWSDNTNHWSTLNGWFPGIGVLPGAGSDVYFNQYSFQDSAYNIILNGNFSADSNADGVADYWSKGANITGVSVSGNVQYFTGSGDLVTTGSNWFSTLTTSPFMSATDKYYVRFDAKYTGASGTLYAGSNYNDFLTQVLTSEFVTYSVIFDRTSLGANTGTKLAFGSNSTAVALQNVVVVNLTRLWGAGNEPDVTYCNTNYTFAALKSGIVLSDGSSLCKDIDWSAVTHYPSFVMNGIFYSHGNVNLGSTDTISFFDNAYAFSLMDSSTVPTHTFNSGGHTFHQLDVMPNHECTISLTADLNGPFTFRPSIDGCTFSTGGYTVTGNSQHSSGVAAGSYICTLDISNSTINVPAASFTVTATNLTLVSSGSVINFTGGAQTFTGGAKTYATVNFNGGTGTIADSNTFNTWNIGTGTTVSLANGTTQTITTDITVGTGASITSPTGANIIFNGATATPITTSYSISKVTVTMPNAPVGKRYWVRGGGDWSDIGHWSALPGFLGGCTIPGDSLDALFEANSFAVSNALEITPSSFQSSQGYLYAGYYIHRGQSFDAAENLAVKSMSFSLKKTGSPTGTLQAHLYACTGTLGTDAVPTGSPLASSTNNFDISTLTGTYQDIIFNFNGYKLTKGTNYCVVLSLTSTSTSSSNYVSLATDSSSPTHNGNSFRSYADPISWAPAVTDDICFAIYGDHIVTVDVSASCKDLNWTDATNAPTLTYAADMIANGAMTFISGMTLNMGTRYITFASTSSLISAGKTMYNVNIWGNFTLLDNLTCNAFQIGSGTIDVSNRIVSCASGFYMNESDTDNKTINIANSTINCKFFDLSDTSHIISWNASGSTININTPYGNTFEVANSGGTSLAFNIVNMPDNNATYSTYAKGICSIDTLNIAAGAVVKFLAGSNFTVTNLNAIGTASNLITLQTDSADTPATLSKTTGAVTVAYCSIKDITATGGATFNANSCTNVSGNSGWNFFAKRFWVNNGGNWSDNTNHWSYSTGGAPGADRTSALTDAIFDAGSFKPINWVENPNFVNANDYFSNDGVSLPWTVAGNVGSFTANGTRVDAVVAPYVIGDEYNYDIIQGHKYYSRVDYMVPTGCSNVRHRLLTGYLDMDYPNPTPNEWHTSSGIGIAGSSFYGIPTVVVMFFPTAAEATGQVLQLREFFFFDLTDLYGAGNEPTQQWCDDNLTLTTTVDGWQTSVVTYDVEDNCKDLNWTGALYNPTFALSLALDYLCGSLTFIEDMIFDHNNYFLDFRYGSAGQTITTAGHDIYGMVFTQEAVGLGEWTLQDDLTITYNINWGGGTFHSGGHTLNLAEFISQNSNVRTIDLTDSTVNIVNAMTMNTTTNQTLITTGSTINHAGAAWDVGSSAGPSVSFNTVNFSGTSSYIKGSNSYATMGFTPGKTYTFVAGTTQTVGALSGEGTSESNRVSLVSDSSGNPFYLSKASGIVSVIFWSLKDCHVSGGATWKALLTNGCVNVSGNDGWLWTQDANTLILDAKYFNTTTNLWVVCDTIVYWNEGTQTWDVYNLI